MSKVNAVKAVNTPIGKGINNNRMHKEEIYGLYTSFIYQLVYNNEIHLLNDEYNKQGKYFTYKNLIEYSHMHTQHSQHTPFHRLLQTSSFYEELSIK